MDQPDSNHWQRVWDMMQQLLTQDQPEARQAIWREIARVAKSANDLFAPPSYSLGTGTMVKILGDPYRALSPNLRLHHMERANRVAEWRGRARLAWLGGERREFKTKARVEFIVRRARAVDNDNMLASCKALIDGLCASKTDPGLLRGDTKEDVEYAPMRQEIHKQWRGNEEVLVYVTPLAGAADATERDFWK